MKIIHYGNISYRRHTSKCGAPRSNDDSHRVNAVTCIPCIMNVLKTTNKWQMWSDRLIYLQSLEIDKAHKAAREVVWS